MIITTCDDVAEKKIVKTLGLVKGNTIRARHVGRDIAALLRAMVGGEVTEYTKLLAESREQSIDRMVTEANKLGANAIITIRFSTAEMLKGCAELLVYGTAVILEDE